MIIFAVICLFYWSTWPEKGAILPIIMMMVLEAATEGCLWIVMIRLLTGAI
jgi:hypothetical protein